MLSPFDLTTPSFVKYSALYFLTSYMMGDGLDVKTYVNIQIKPFMWPIVSNLR
jgi:hypothetical protein